MSKIDLTISVAKDDVYKEVMLVTNYLGAKDKPDLSTYETIAYTSEQSEMLDRWWHMACTTVTDIIKPYISGTPDTSSKYEVACKMPSNWNQYLSTDISATIYDYFVNYICSQWMRITMDQESQQSVVENKYATDAVAFISEIKRKIYDRIRPTKPTYTFGEDETVIPED